MTTTDNRLYDALRASGYSCTTARQNVFRALVKLELTTMHQLVQHVSDTTDRSSVYRTIDLFMRIGIAQKVPSGWKHRIELSERFSPHHHHIACKQCGKTVTFHIDNELERHILDNATASGFAEITHQIELQGVCLDCQMKH